MEGNDSPSWDSDDLISYIPSNYLEWMSFMDGYGPFIRSSFSEASFYSDESFRASSFTRRVLLGI